MGARAYRYLSLYEPDPGVLVEVGSDRGEGSTAWLADYAKTHGLRFYTADIDPTAYEAAKRVTPGARLCSGQELLRRVGKVSIAYLDGYDWVHPDDSDEAWVHAQRASYERLGLPHSNAASEAEHLEEAIQIARKAAKRCAVVCDDTFYEDGWNGKGAKAVPHLVGAGFQVVDHQGREEHSLGCVVMKRG